MIFSASSCVSNVMKPYLPNKNYEQYYYCTFKRFFMEMTGRKKYFMGNLKKMQLDVDVSPPAFSKTACF